MIVDDVERRQQPLATLAVEIADRAAQLADRLGQIVALGDHLGRLRLDLGQFVVGAQIDGAETFAICLQLVEPLADLVGRRQFVAGRDACEFRELFGRAFQFVFDRAQHVGETLPRGFHTGFGPGPLLA